MANARALDKRRKSIRNIKKITRTMELIATARFKKAMDRATAANDYTGESPASLPTWLARAWRFLTPCWKAVIKPIVLRCWC